MRGYTEIAQEKVEEKERKEKKRKRKICRYTDIHVEVQTRRPDALLSLQHVFDIECVLSL